jgi:hypothetical protein
VTAKPLAFVYLSQIPYTGIEMGPFAATLYWLAIISWAGALTYLIIFKCIPATRVQFARARTRINHAVAEALSSPTHAPARASVLPPVMEHAVMHAPRPESHSPPPAPEHPAPQPFEEEEVKDTRPYSAYDGFKSFATNGALSIEDIVKGLSRSHAEAFQRNRKEGLEPETRTEPVYDLVEPIEEPKAVPATAAAEGTSIHSFLASLIAGDRTGVFAGLREHTQKGGSPNKLIEQTVCMLDDVYRGRIDMSPCDEQTARLTARLDTPTLEKLVSALTTAIDTGYTDATTAAKLALTRALSAIGA